jgi:hypothetical protein
LISPALAAVADHGLDELTGTPPAGTGPDRCDGIDITSVTDRVATATNELASTIDRHSDGALARTVTVDGVVGNVIGLARHGLHDAHHHLLDVTRNLAGMRLDESFRRSRADRTDRRRSPVET